MKGLFRFHKYAFAWENYLLFFRALAAACLIRACLKDSAASPLLSSALQAVDKIYLPAQAGWQITEPERIVRFAAFVVTLPRTWGSCVQQSLISYRLLNGYGYPARICFGIRAENPEMDGHAWVFRPSHPEKALGETADPRERFKVIYTSPLP